MFSGRTLLHGASVWRKIDKPYLCRVRVMHLNFVYPKYYINYGKLNELKIFHSNITLDNYISVNTAK